MIDLILYFAFVFMGVVLTVVSVGVVAVKYALPEKDGGGYVHVGEHKNNIDASESTGNVGIGSNLFENQSKDTYNTIIPGDVYTEESKGDSFVQEASHIQGGIKGKKSNFDNVYLNGRVDGDVDFRKSDLGEVTIMGKYDDVNLSDVTSKKIHIPYGQIKNLDLSDSNTENIHIEDILLGPYGETKPKINEIDLSDANSKKILIDNAKIQNGIYARGLTSDYVGIGSDVKGTVDISKSKIKSLELNNKINTLKYDNNVKIEKLNIGSGTKIDNFESGDQLTNINNYSIHSTAQIPHQMKHTLEEGKRFFDISSNITDYAENKSSEAPNSQSQQQTSPTPIQTIEPSTTINPQETISVGSTPITHKAKTSQ